MKPLGTLLIISGTAAETDGLDDDYEWYVRQVASARLTAAPDHPSRLAFLRERCRAMVLLLRSRAGEPFARRT